MTSGNVFVVTVPKSGTYLASKILERLGNFEND